MEVIRRVGEGLLGGRGEIGVSRSRESLCFSALLYLCSTLLLVDYSIDYRKEEKALNDEHHAGGVS
mgnify:CR=1 FL=1